jgi:hypothetical protein
MLLHPSLTYRRSLATAALATPSRDSSSLHSMPLSAGGNGMHADDDQAPSARTGTISVRSIAVDESSQLLACGLSQYVLPPLCHNTNMHLFFLALPS